MDLREAMALLERIQEHFKYNKLDKFMPYDYQHKFYRAGAKHLQRYMRAGNRTGKSYGAAFEFAQHITGRYAEWWDGLVIHNSGHTFWCVGVDLDSVSKVMQKELLGTADVRQEELLGTGAIPRDNIIMENISKDGARVRTIFIKHKDGGTNTLHFYGANNEATMMGQTVKGVWMDEEPEFNSLALYSQCVTRTATTNGFVMLTATPEQGYTDLNRMFDEDTTGHLYVQSVGWDECPHITPEIAEQLLAGIPEYQHEMRKNGIPVLGSGAVFPFDDSDISIPSVPIKRHWTVVAGIDFGSVVDPSVIVYAAHDPDNDVYYLWSEDVLGGSENDPPEDREPYNIAQTILNGPVPRILTVVPHDAGLNSKASEAKGKQLIEYGVNVFRRTFRNPTETVLEFKQNHSGRVAHNSIEVGLSTMRKLFFEGRLKVSQRMSTFFKEKRSYFYTDSNKPVDRDNHVIDASRYAVMSLIDNIGSTFESAANKDEPKYTQQASSNLSF